LEGEGEAFASSSSLPGLPVSSSLDLTSVIFGLIYCGYCFVLSKKEEKVAMDGKGRG
jgi:hypothetical protein